MSRSELESLERSHWDAVVIGAGPAGSLAALRLARGGRSVLLVDKGAFPRYKVCGGCLNGRAMSILKSMGLENVVTESGGVSLHRFSLCTSKRLVELDLPGGFAISRTTLDTALAEVAVSEGVQFLDETRAVLGNMRQDVRTLSLHRDGHEVEVSAGYVLAAGGLGFRVGDEIKSTVARRARIGAGVLFHDSNGDLEPGIIHMAVSRHGYVGMVRIEDNLLNVAAAFDVPFVREQGTPAHAAANVLAGCEFLIPEGLLDAEWRGTPPLMQTPSDVAGNRLLLIGDAAGYVEPFTGEGMAWAFESGNEAAGIVIESEGSPEIVAEQWRMRHRDLFRNSQRRCRAVAVGLRHPALVNIGAAVLRRHPGLAQPILRRLNQPVSTQRSP